MADEPGRDRERSRSEGTGRCKAVFLDLDDTLVETTAIDREAVASAAKLAVERDPSLPDAGALVDRFKALLKAEPFPPDGSDITLQAWRTSLWGRALERPGTSLAEEVYNRWVDERLQGFVFPGEVQQLLRRLAAVYKLCIITNGHADAQRPKLVSCDAASFFDERALVVSGEQPEAKPHASIFLTACERLSVAPHEAVMVGDSLASDVQGGINAGLLATVWVQGACEAPAPAEGPQPTAPSGASWTWRARSRPSTVARASSERTIIGVLDTQSRLASVGLLLRGRWQDGSWNPAQAPGERILASTVVLQLR
eukprot:CAMPEP_0175679870 /NCGR_PEP_ID=MMETSP0097-20121207/24504_1 /TAXON_ID=311494 /ORGANISM="Alexandrium monilatum, Strain CCMP3105" /LENGTH=311 /DNA_ID=CAMNT_0016986701 /DNA_START=21 /DNA_END=957 /DNA_ORIENTATION=-